jgi:DNA repair protein RadC
MISQVQHNDGLGKNMISKVQHMDGLGKKMISKVQHMDGLGKSMISKVQHMDGLGKSMISMAQHMDDIFYSHARKYFCKECMSFLKGSHSSSNMVLDNHKLICKVECHGIYFYKDETLTLKEQLFLLRKY